MRAWRYWALTTTSGRGIKEGVLNAREWNEQKLCNELQARGVVGAKITHKRLRKNEYDARGLVVAEWGQE